MQPQRGFSLLELLVVLFVVVIITSLVTLTINSGGQDLGLDTEVGNLADVAGYALDEAQLSGLDYGLLLRRRFEDGFSRYSYSWRQRRPEGWRQPQPDSELFTERDFAPGLELQLTLEDLPVPEFADDAAAPDTAPQVIFYSSGETTPGALEFRREDSGELLWRVQWDLLGRFELQRRGQAADTDGDDV